MKAWRAARKTTLTFKTEGVASKSVTGVGACPYGGCGIFWLGIVWLPAIYAGNRWRFVSVCCRGTPLWLPRIGRPAERGHLARSFEAVPLQGYGVFWLGIVWLPAICAGNGWCFIMVCCGGNPCGCPFPCINGRRAGTGACPYGIPVCFVWVSCGCRQDKPVIACELLWYL